MTNSLPSFAVSMVSKASLISPLNKSVFRTLNSKEDIFQLIEQLYIISPKHNLKLAPENFFFRLLKLEFLGHETGYKTIKPMRSKLAANHKHPSHTGKVALLKFIGALNFYTKFTKKLNINLKPFL